MVLARVDFQLDRVARRAQRRRQPLAVAGAHGNVRPAADQQHRWRARRGEMNRLGLVQARPLAHRGHRARVGERQEIIRPRQQRGGADGARIDPGIAEVMVIERQQRGDMRPGRMTGQRDPRRIAAIGCGMVAHPPHCCRAILDEAGEANLRRQPVIGDDRDEIMRRERPPGKAIAAALARIPRPAVKEDHHRQ